MPNQQSPASSVFHVLAISGVKPALLIALVLAVFGQSRHHNFVLFDDNMHLYENPHLRPEAIADLRGLKAFWQKPYFGLYIPLTYTVWTAVAKLSPRDAKFSSSAGMNPAPFHLTNLLFHVANVLLVYWLIQTMGASGFAAFLATAFWAIHPLQAEVVAWAAGLKDSLMTFFLCLALISFYKAFSERPREFRWLLMTALCYALALLAKPAAAAFPLILAALPFLSSRFPRKPTLGFSVTLLLLSLPLILATQDLQPEAKSAVVTPLFLRHFIAGDAIAFYAAKVFAPFALALDYGRSPDIVLGQQWGYLTWLAPLGFFYYCYLTKKKRLALFVTLVILGLSPVLGFLPFRFQQFSSVSDRYLYFPLIFAALGFAFLLDSPVFAKIRNFLLPALIGLSVLGFRQAAIWHDNHSLFEHMLRVNPSSLIAHNNLANTYEREGKLELAYVHYNKALKQRPDWLDIRYNVSAVLAKLQRWDEALEQADLVLSYEPGYADAYFIKGLICADSGRFPQAEHWYRRALKLRPSNPKYLTKLATTLTVMGRNLEAIDLFQLSAKLDPGLGETYNNWGVVLMRMKRESEAIELFEQALLMAPRYAEARVNLADCLFRQKRWSEAKEHYRYYLTLRPDSPEVKSKLASLK